MIDLFSNEYGWTTEQFFKLTFREFRGRLLAIYERKRKDLIFNAKIHGAEIKDSGKSNELENKTIDLAYDLSKKMLEKRMEKINKGLKND